MFPSSLLPHDHMPPSWGWASAVLFLGRGISPEAPTLAFLVLPNPGSTIPMLHVGFCLLQVYLIAGWSQEESGGARRCKGSAFCLQLLLGMSPSPPSHPCPVYLDFPLDLAGAET